MTAGFEQALAEAQDWIDIEGVEVVGQGKVDDRDCIVVYVSLPARVMQERVPATLHGIPVEVRHSGIITPESP